MRLVKSGISGFKNLGMLELFIALIRMLSYSRLGSARFREPAMTKRDLTARMPKS